MDELSINGLRVFVSNSMPSKVFVSSSFEWITDEGRANMNAWLREMFGPIDDMLWMPNRNACVCSPEQFEVLKTLDHSSTGLAAPNT